MSWRCLCSCAPCSLMEEALRVCNISGKGCAPEQLCTIPAALQGGVPACKSLAYRTLLRLRLGECISIAEFVSAFRDACNVLLTIEAAPARTECSVHRACRPGPPPPPQPAGVNVVGRTDVCWHCEPPGHHKKKYPQLTAGTSSSK